MELKIRNLKINKNYLDKLIMIDLIHSKNEFLDKMNAIQNPIINIREWEIILSKFKFTEQEIINLESKHISGVISDLNKKLYWLYVSYTQKLSTSFILQYSDKLVKTDFLKNHIRSKRALEMLSKKYNMVDINDIILSFI